MKPSEYEIIGRRLLEWAGKNLGSEEREDLSRVIEVLRHDPNGVPGVMPMRPLQFLPNTFSVPFAAGKWLLAFQVTIDIPAIKLIRITPR